MKTYDWIIVGAGFAGAAVSYELAKKGFSVLLLEQNAHPANATRFSYGGIPYWSGTTPLTRQLCQEGIDRYQTLSEELDYDIQFRELDLLLTIPVDQNPTKFATNTAQFAIPPRLLSVNQAVEMEPLLNPNLISGALTVRHGHVHPEAIVQGYQQGFLRAGGTIEIAQVQELERKGDRIFGVTTSKQTYHGDRTLICAGGWSRSLLKASGIPIKLYFTHAEVIQTPPVEVKLSTLVMPAEMARWGLEIKATQPELDYLWDQPGQEILPPILEAGAVQFLDNSLRIGQISRFLTDVDAQVDPINSETEIRTKVGQILPKLADLPGNWHQCLVAFSPDHLPLVGSLPELDGIEVFSGFSSPFALLPAIAQHFAKFAHSQNDEIIPHLSPTRFIS